MLEREVANLNNYITQLSSEHPDTNVLVENYVHDGVTLPKDSNIAFYLGDEQREGWDHRVSVRIDRQNRNRLIINGGGYFMYVQPSSSNQVYILFGDRG